MPTTQPNLSLIHGLACLQQVVSFNRPVGTRELSRLLKLEHTRVSRLLGTLESLGLVHQNPNKKYMPGAGVHVLAALSLRGSGLIQAALPLLRALRDESLIIAVGMLWNDQVAYLLHSPPEHPLEAGIGGHELYPAMESSIGLAILAHLPRYSPPKGLRSKFATIRRDGWAAIVNADGTLSIGVAVGSPPICGIALAGDIKKNSIPRLAKKLQETASQLSHILYDSIKPN